ncbi:Ig-like domain-containing protein, partial [Pseudomonas fluorescens]|uniref:Ig-like domain-containing protein n=1 Tax=Pseudomonas fluorescens TaxID=294 RepID=UPI0017842B39
TAKVIDLEATPATIKANGTDASQLVATVEDASGNPVAGATVNWTTTTGQLSASSTTTDAQGKARVTFSGTDTGSADITAAAIAGSSTAVVDLVADGTTAKVLGVGATPYSIKADGVQTSTLVAMVVDANDNPVPGARVTWSKSIGQLSAASSTTDAQGKASVTLKGVVAGTSAIKATAVSGFAETAVDLTPDASTSTVTGLTASPTLITANDTATSTLSATVRDANGNLLPAGQTVTFTTTSGTLSASTATTNASGVASITLKGTTAGTATVTAKAATAATKTATVALVADASTAAVTGLTTSPTSITANGTATSTLSATVRDANGNPLPVGQTVTFTTTSGTLSASTATTNASGVASVTLKGTAAGTATVTAKAATAATKTATVALLADASTSTVTGLTASPTSITANGTATSTLSATVRDANGNPLPVGQTVTFTTTSGTL